MLFLTPHPQLSHTGGPDGEQSKNNVWEQCWLFWEDNSLFLGRSGRKSLLTFFFPHPLETGNDLSTGCWAVWWHLGNMSVHPAPHRLMWFDLFWSRQRQDCVKPRHDQSSLLFLTENFLSFAFSVKCHFIWTQSHSFVQNKYCLQATRVACYLYFSFQTQVENPHKIIKNIF